MPPRKSNRSAAAAAKAKDDLAVEVKDPLAVDALEAAEAAIEDDEVAMAAAAAAAAVDASDGMAVVVDQALLATAAAAAASQVAKLLSEQPADGSIPQDNQLGLYPVKIGEEDGDLLEARRVKDRKRYSAMTPDARASYNAHRRDLYHKQGEAARKRRRERERDRYHSLEGEAKKLRNERRAKLERDRYNKLGKAELAERNARRRDRSKTRKSVTPKGEKSTTTTVPGLPLDSTALAAEVAEQVMAESEGPTVQI